MKRPQSKKLCFLLIILVVLIVLISGVTIALSESDDCGFWCRIVNFFSGEPTGAVIGDISACPSGMVSYWGLDNNTHDDFGSNNGVINGVTFVSGKVCVAGSFDVVDVYIDLGNENSLQITGTQTIAIWVNLNEVPPGDEVHTFIRKVTDGFHYYGNNDNPSLEGIYTSSGTKVPRTLVTLNTGQWYHLVF